MPIYTVEKQYLLPIYKSVQVETDSVEDACRKVAADDNWEFAEEDWDNSRETTISQVAEGEFDSVHDAPTETRRDVPDEYRLEDLEKKIKDLEAQLAAFVGSRAVRHKKRGSTYNVMGDAEVQISAPIERLGRVDGGRILREGDKLTVYRCRETGKLWARFPDEFEDGRFEELG